MSKDNLAMNNLQWLICHKTKPNKTNFSLCQPNFVRCLYAYTLVHINTKQKLFSKTRTHETSQRKGQVKKTFFSKKFYIRIFPIF